LRWSCWQMLRWRIHRIIGIRITTIITFIIRGLAAS
jgi:hypothetical protein